MATTKKKTNGHDPATERMVAVLERIEGELHKTNTRLDVLHDDVVALQAGQRSIVNELRGLRSESRAELEDHGERLAKLEKAVFKRAG